MYKIINTKRFSRRVSRRVFLRGRSKSFSWKKATKKIQIMLEACKKIRNIPKKFASQPSMRHHPVISNGQISGDTCSHHNFIVSSNISAQNNNNGRVNGSQDKFLHSGLVSDNNQQANYNQSNHLNSHNTSNSCKISISQPDLSLSGNNNSSLNPTQTNLSNHLNMLQTSNSNLQVEGLNLDKNEVKDPIHSLGLTPTQIADELRSLSTDLISSLNMLFTEITTLRSQYLEESAGKSVVTRTVSDQSGKSKQSLNLSTQRKPNVRATNSNNDQGTNPFNRINASLKYSTAKSTFADVGTAELHQIQTPQSSTIMSGTNNYSTPVNLQNALRNIIEIANQQLDYSIQNQSNYQNKVITSYASQSVGQNMNNISTFNNLNPVSTIINDMNPSHRGNNLQYGSNGSTMNSNYGNTLGRDTIGIGGYESSKSEIWHDAEDEFFLSSAAEDRDDSDESDPDVEDSEMSNSTTESEDEMDGNLEEGDNGLILNSPQQQIRNKGLTNLEHDKSIASTLSGTISETIELQKPRIKLPHVKETNNVNIWNIIKPLIGKDLTKVAMPVILNEPLGALQKCCEDLEYYELLDQAKNTESEVDRINLVALFAISAYYSSQFRASTKPFNPLLGETFEYQNESFKFISEQVSHHPPLSAAYAISHDGGWKFEQVIRYKTKFWGRSMLLGC